MSLEHAFRKYKVRAFRNRNQLDADNDATHAESATTAPYTAFTGVTLQKGAALAAEIENYRRRVVAVLNFFEYISPLWWDQLHQFNSEMIKRPSKSADMLLEVQSRLKARLSRLTTRMVIPAAAAVITIEERDTVPVLPKNLLRDATDREKKGYKLDGFENTQEMLRLSYSIARRLGEVERSKQQMILYAADWVKSDGRDFSLRAQRIALLTKHIQFSLIERFQGVQALITHYYRRRATKPTDVADTADEKDDPKQFLKRAFYGVTAASLNATNPEILKIISSADLSLATDATLNTDFIKNYAPNMFHTNYSFTSSSNDDIISQLKLSDLEPKQGAFHTDAGHTGGYKPQTTTSGLTNMVKQSIRQPTCTDARMPSKALEQVIEYAEEDVDGYVIDLEETTTAFHKQRQRSSETYQKEESSKTIEKLIALRERESKMMFDDGVEDEDVEYFFPPPQVKQKSSSTAAATTLLNPQSFCSLDTRDDSLGNANVKAGDSIVKPAPSGKPSKATTSRFTSHQRLNSQSSTKIREVPKTRISTRPPMRKSTMSPISNNMPVEEMISTNFRNLLQLKKSSRLRRSLSTRRKIG